MQNIVYTDTYGLEFVEDRIFTYKIIYLHNSLSYLGVPVHEKSFMFGDN